MGDFLQFRGEIRDELVGTAYLLVGNHGQATELAREAMDLVRTRWTTVSRSNPRDRLYEFLLRQFLDGFWPRRHDPAYWALPRVLWELDTDRRALAVACFHIWRETPRAVYAARWELEAGQEEAGRLLRELEPGGASVRLREEMARLAAPAHPPAEPPSTDVRSPLKGWLAASSVFGLLMVAAAMVSMSGMEQERAPLSVVQPPALVEETMTEEPEEEEKPEALDEKGRLPKTLDEPIRFAYSCDDCDAAWRLVGTAGKVWDFDDARAWEDDGYVRVSPDGRTLAYLADKRRLMVRDLRSGRTREVSDKVEDGNLAFSANSRYLVADSGEYASTSARPVLHDLETGRTSRIPISCCVIGVSDAGVVLLAGQAKADDVPGFATVSRVMEFRFGDARPRARFQIEADLWDSAGHLSPDGRTLAFVVARAAEPDYSLVTMDAGDGRVLTDKRVRLDDAPSHFAWRDADEVVIVASSQYSLVKVRTGKAEELEVPDQLTDVDGLTPGLLP
ncbi:PD40 domain-containing protein [Nonomuraea soli]|uniref:WD40 repeat domain-containing protein n=1 Tax=Nonomuraea soli TaxID=1032476 RepID=A0A7W0HSR0_9ACTN|nr:PD40 domain-containing protein [Nonomuraea soli]MBA2894187.1 hypothetical protein [Nonomuraea soli]